MGLFKNIWQLSIGPVIVMFIAILVLSLHHRTALPNIDNVRQYYNLLNTKCIVSTTGKQECSSNPYGIFMIIGTILFALFSGVAVVAYIAGERFHKSVLVISSISTIWMLMLSIVYYINMTKGMGALSPEMESFNNNMLMYFAVLLEAIFAGTGAVAFICDQLFTSVKGMVGMEGGRKKYRY